MSVNTPTRSWPPSSATTPRGSTSSGLQERSAPPDPQPAPGLRADREGRMDRDEVPFVGRRDEVEARRRALDPASGTRFLLVAGDPGIGKSRLLAELVTAARASGAAVGATRALE